MKLPELSLQQWKRLSEAVNQWTPGVPRQGALRRLAELRPGKKPRRPSKAQR